MCRGSNSSSVQALALDHRNDVVSNSVALVCGYLGKSSIVQLVYSFEFYDVWFGI